MTERPKRITRTVVILAVVLASLAAGLLISDRIVSGRACDRWRVALDDLTTSSEGLLGTETAKQFRMEAIRRGWVDVGGEHVTRPSGCSP
jgi:hypothetical protein